MSFADVAAFAAMGGHGVYVWSAWGFVALTLLWLALTPWRRHRRWLRRLRGARRGERR